MPALRTFHLNSFRDHGLAPHFGHPNDALASMHIAQSSGRAEDDDHGIRRRALNFIPQYDTCTASPSGLQATWKMCFVLIVGASVFSGAMAVDALTTPPQATHCQR